MPSVMEEIELDKDDLGKAVALTECLFWFSLPKQQLSL